MKLTSFVIAAGLIAVPALALAQSAPAPVNQSGPGVSPTVQSPTDMGTAGQSGNTKAVPSRGVHKRSAMRMKRKGHMTGAAVKEEQNKVSTPPSSMGESIKKEK
jgi:hypothetical protein